MCCNGVVEVKQVGRGTLLQGSTMTRAVFGKLYDRYKGNKFVRKKEYLFSQVRQTVEIVPTGLEEVLTTQFKNLRSRRSNFDELKVTQMDNGF